MLLRRAAHGSDAFSGFSEVCVWSRRMRFHFSCLVAAALINFCSANVRTGARVFVLLFLLPQTDVFRAGCHDHRTLLTIDGSTTEGMRHLMEHRYEENPVFSKLAAQPPLVTAKSIQVCPSTHLLCDVHGSHIDHALPGGAGDALRSACWRHTYPVCSGASNGRPVSTSLQGALCSLRACCALPSTDIAPGAPRRLPRRPFSLTTSRPLLPASRLG